MLNLVQGKFAKFAKFNVNLPKWTTGCQEIVLRAAAGGGEACRGIPLAGAAEGGPAGDLGAEHLRVVHHPAGRWQGGTHLGKCYPNV